MVESATKETDTTSDVSEKISVDLGKKDMKKDLKKDIKKDTEQKSLIKKSWSPILMDVTRALGYTWLTQNIILVSKIIWPTDPVHLEDLFYLYGLGIYVVAFSGLLFGFLSDRFSRKKLMVVVTIGYGGGILVNGIISVGAGATTFFWFLIISLIRQFFDGGGSPITNSFINDAVEETQRSQYFGTANILHMLVWILGMVISAVFFENGLWREFLVGNGVITIVSGVIIFIYSPEPKRGASKRELKTAIAKNGVYSYKLDRNTFKDTILRPTNTIIFIEGIFTNIIASIPLFLLIAYIEDTPYNISPTVVSLMEICFAIPGIIIGLGFFSKVSDKLALKNPKNRIYLILFGNTVTSIMYVLFFYVPMTPMSIPQGAMFGFVMSQPWHWALGVTMFLGFCFSGLYGLNQVPILQIVNLPESQGLVSGINQFLDYIGHGTGPILIGLLFSIAGKSYQNTMLIAVIIGLIGMAFWIIATRYINKDISRISQILTMRAKEMEK